MLKYQFLVSSLNNLILEEKFYFFIFENINILNFLESYKKPCQNVQNMSLFHQNSKICCFSQK